MEKAALISLLEKHEAFESSPPEALEQLIDAAEVTSLEEAAPLIQQGRRGESIWMLIEGELDILVDGEQVKISSFGTFSVRSKTSAARRLDAPIDGKISGPTLINRWLRSSPVRVGRAAEPGAKGRDKHRCASHLQEESKTSRALSPHPASGCL